jgi:hypothetical protein
MEVKQAAVTHVRETSNKLLLLFTGQREQMGYPILEFLKRTHTTGANFVIFRDATKTNYQKGISAQYDSPDRIADWVRERLVDTFPHVEDVLSIGNSGGGGTAIHVGHALEAKAVWSLAGLVPNQKGAAEREAFRRRVRLRVLGREDLPLQLTREQLAALRAADREPEVQQWAREVDDNPEVLIDQPILRGLVDALTNRPKRTIFHFYYVTTNVVDRYVAEAFRGCPNAFIHPVTPPWTEQDVPPWSRFMRGPPDHAVVQILDVKKQLHTLFSGYV